VRCLTSTTVCWMCACVRTTSMTRYPY
jgi:hypothetical protein